MVKFLSCILQPLLQPSQGSNHPQILSHECHPSAYQKDANLMVPNQNCTEDGATQFTQSWQLRF
jgi:hypothetical protein